MLFKDLIRSFEIIEAHEGNLESNVVHTFEDCEEFGFTLHPERYSVEEIRFFKMAGWNLGFDSEYDEEDSESWNNLENISDSEVIELFNKYNAISSFQ